MLRMRILNSLDTRIVTGGSQDDRKSTTGWVFSLGSCVVAWSSKTQPIIKLSNTEAEYISVTAADYEAVWLRKLLEDLNEKQNGPSIILCENRSAITIAKNPVSHDCTEHIDTCYHFIRNLIKYGLIEVKHCCIDLQNADVFTNALPNGKFKRLSEELKVCEFSDEEEHVGEQGWSEPQPLQLTPNSVKWMQTMQLMHGESKLIGWEYLTDFGIS